MAPQMIRQEVTAEDRQKLCPLEAARVAAVEYRFFHQIGVGSQCTVYKAVDEWGNKLVVKVYEPQVNRALWRNEVAQLRRFHSPWTPYLHAVFEHQERAFLVMSDGGWSVARCKFSDQKAREKAAIAVAQSVGQILMRMHAQAHFHGDVSPENVLLKFDADNRLRSVCLTDFALCTPVSSLANGKPAMAGWMPAPEYLLGQPLAGSCLDTWHLAAVLLALLQANEVHYSSQQILANCAQQDALALGGDVAPQLAPALSLHPDNRPSVLQLWQSICQLQHART